MNLYQATQELLAVLPDPMRSHLITYVMEGYPLKSGIYVDSDGSRCLVGACFTGTEDNFGYFNQMMWLRDQLPTLPYIEHLFDMVAFVDPEEARSIISQAIKDWMPTHIPTKEAVTA